MKEWLAEQTSEFRAALPDAVIAIDKWHLVALAHTVVTELRHGSPASGWAGAAPATTRRGRTGQCSLAPNGNPPSSGAGFWEGLDEVNDPKEIQAARAVKERLRMLLGQREPSKIRWALADFYRLPEATRLAGPSNAGGPPSSSPSAVASPTPTNARTEGFNRIIKQVKRVVCGFRYMINYQRRIMALIAVTRPRWSTA